MALIAAALLSFAIYAQWRVASFTSGAGRVALVRFILIAVGIGFGLTSVAAVEGTLAKVLGFAIGFGLVHMPAAIILFIKGKRGAGRS